jgi:hypothetical protein
LNTSRVFRVSVKEEGRGRG